MTDIPTPPDAVPPQPSDRPGESSSDASPDPSQDTQAAWPPDAYTPRAEIARAKGLEAPYIAGGDDPNLDATLAKEQPYLRLLIAMIAVIVIGGFVIGIIGVLVVGGAPK